VDEGRGVVGSTRGGGGGGGGVKSAVPLSCIL